MFRGRRSCATSVRVYPEAFCPRATLSPTPPIPLTPFTATLTDDTANAAPLSPLSTSLTPTPSAKSFPWVSYEKHPGGGVTSLQTRQSQNGTRCRPYGQQPLWREAELRCSQLGGPPQKAVPTTPREGEPQEGHLKVAATRATLVAGRSSTLSALCEAHSLWCTITLALLPPPLRTSAYSASLR
jgi:hypothetical protein